MRKLLLFSFSIILIAIILLGCKIGTPVPKDLVTSFTAESHIKYKNENLVGNISSTNEGVFTVTITEPKALLGLTYKWLGGEYAIEYKNLKTKSYSLHVPNSSFCCGIINVIKRASVKENITLLNVNDKTATYIGESDSGDFVITTDNETGYITEIKIDDLELLATFTMQKKI